MSKKVKQFVDLYKAAQTRAVPCGAGHQGRGGVAFLKEDRAALVAMMWEMGQTPNQLGYALGKELGYVSNHVSRLRTFEAQVNTGVIRLAPAPTGEHTGKYKPVTISTGDKTFDGRIKTLQDVQPAFDRAVRQLIRVGITSPQAVTKYIHSAFENVKVEQKIESKAERIVRELRIGDLTKDQVLVTLERVKNSF